MTTVPEFISSYAESHLNHFIVAAEHTFDCNCMDCITFLYTTGDDMFDPANKTYVEIHTSPVSDDKLSLLQITLLRLLFNTYL